MKALILACLLALTPLLSLATGTKPAQPAPYANAAADASSSAKAAGGASTSSATGGNAYGAPVSITGGGYGGDNLYVLPAPIGGSNLPAGMCQRSKYSHRAFVFNFISLADGDSHTDMECLRLLAELERLKAQPLPKPEPVAILTAPQRPTNEQQAAAACTPPAKAKTVAEAKKAGACK